jgi:hypothetical protein
MKYRKTGNLILRNINNLLTIRTKRFIIIKKPTTVRIESKIY